MSGSRHKKRTLNEVEDSIVAEEIFKPDLSHKFNRKFEDLLVRLKNNLSISRDVILDEEIKRAKMVETEDDISFLKYITSLYVLRDLSLQGWIFNISDKGLMLRMENDNLDNKSTIRYRLSAEKNAQFSVPAIRKFILSMETPREHNGEIVSIKNLIGNKDELIKFINHGEQVCCPYIQIVTEDKDEFTGISLYDIWRYFRYTWSIPYKTMPGRNLFYLVRDSRQKYHPVIGIFALGNSVLNLTSRDDDIGWTVESIRQNLSKKIGVTICDQKMSKSDGKVKVKILHANESDDAYKMRITQFANTIMPLLEANIKNSINDIYVKDLNFHKQTKHPKQELIDNLLSLSLEFNRKAINNHNNEKNPDWLQETKSFLFLRKRSAELAKLLVALKVFDSLKGTCLDKLEELLSTENGRKAINTALIANRKCKIGSNMMDIIVCGSIPPYNDLLGGKLVSILACSPTVIRDYTKKYENQISVIASRMKGAKVIRDSHLVFLGTTSLYSLGSSQYNRLKIPCSNDFSLEFRKMGITEGFGTVYFSSETTRMFSKVLESLDGGKRINHVFGEGTSPRFRMISRGLKEIGINPSSYLKHHSPRIVYSINLAKNTRNFLLGIDDKPIYNFNIEDKDDVVNKTQELVDYWYERWLKMRLYSVDIVERLQKFDIDRFLLSNFI